MHVRRPLNKVVFHLSFFAFLPSKMTVSNSPFDLATNTSFLGKTDKDTFVFTGVASNVS
jgi:hypothetical protein